MPKINQEEYEILKEKYDIGGKWIARDADGLLYYYKERPNKLEHPSDNVWDSNSFPMDIIGDGKKLFHFVKWSDSSPYNIDELIREYEIKELRLAPSGTVIVDSFDESEGTEVKKDKEWLIKRVENYIPLNDKTVGHVVDNILDIIHQLDEPEVNSQIDKLANFIMSEVEGEPSQSQSAVDTAIRIIKSYQNQETLSQKWINNNSINASHDGVTDEYVHVDDLQNLLVPKQEELEVKIQELIESYKQEEDAYSNPENGWISGFIEDLKNLVEKEQKYYVLGKYDTPILFRDYRNRITETSNLSEIYPKANSEDFEFTEKEIKDYDPRYWAFRKPV